MKFQLGVDRRAERPKISQSQTHGFPGESFSRSQDLMQKHKIADSISHLVLNFRHQYLLIYRPLLQSFANHEAQYPKTQGRRTAKQNYR